MRVPHTHTLRLVALLIFCGASLYATFSHRITPGSASYNTFSPSEISGNPAWNQSSTQGRSGARRITDPQAPQPITRQQPQPPRVQEISGRLNSTAVYHTYPLEEVFAGDTLYMYIETLSDKLDLTIALYDENNPEDNLAEATLSSTQRTGSFSFVVNEDSVYAVEVLGAFGKSTGDYRLLIGVNAPDVLTGEAAPVGKPFFETLPTFGEVHVGIYVLQITEINQLAEEFTIEAVLNAEWQGDCPLCLQENKLIFTDKGVEEVIGQAGLIWPEFTFANQRGLREIENNALVWNERTGVFWYEERFHVTLQMLIDFTVFPFDRQEIALALESFGYTLDNLRFQVWEEKTGISDHIGAEAWIIHETDVSLTTGTQNRVNYAQFRYEITIGRHLTFYIYRIFIPIVLILLLTWLAFFLKDHDTRINTASGTFLVFIAFNFTIAEELPRISYLTFMDGLLIICFVVTAFTVGLNIVLKRLADAQKTLVDKLDRWLIWGYPVFYLVGFVMLIVFFL